MDKHLKDNVGELPDIDTVSDLLDKLTLKHLYLLEEKMQAELKIESHINNGSIHLAKSRYIMGQNSVCATRLPIDSSPEFSASTVCTSIENDGVIQLQATKNDAENTVNPLHWFGVFVPQNLHKAQSIFQNAVNNVVECVNVQLQISNNLKNIKLIKAFLSSLNENS